VGVDVWELRAQLLEQRLVDARIVLGEAQL
jgi:hypothetical protein